MSNLFTARKSTEVIVIHCAATTPTQDIGVKEIRSWHRKRGFTDIGYHYVIRRDGYIEEGRPEHVVGAHAKGFNRHSLAICMVGGVDEDLEPEDNFTRQQYATLENLLNELKVSYPGVDILGHCDLPRVAKACPSFSVRKWLRSLESGSVKPAPSIAYVTITPKLNTIWALAKYYGYNPQVMVDLNSELDPAKLQVGQKIKVPNF